MSYFFGKTIAFPLSHFFMQKFVISLYVVCLCMYIVLDRMDYLSQYIFAGSKGCNRESCESTTCVVQASDKHCISTVSTGSDDVPMQVVNKCPMCCAQFQSRLKMQFHLALKHQHASQIAQMGQESRPSFMLPCPFCGKIFPNSKTLNFHKRLCLPNQLKLKQNHAMLKHRVNKHPMKSKESLNKKSTFSYICICGQHFLWKSLYLHHKKICKTRRKSEKRNNHYHHKKEKLNAKADSEFTALSENNSINANLCGILSSDETYLENTVVSMDRECPSITAKSTDKSHANNEANSISEKNDLVHFEYVDKITFGPNSKKDCLKDEEKGHQGDSESDGPTREDCNINQEEDIKSAVVLKKEPQEDDSQISSMELSQKPLEVPSSELMEMVCALEDSKKSQIVTNVNSIVPRLPDKNIDHETFYMEDEVAVVDLSNMKVSMNCPSVPGENLTASTSNKVGEGSHLYPSRKEETGHTSSDQKGKDDLQVLNLSNKPDSREDRQEMQNHYKQRSGVKEVTEMFSQCPNCLGTFRSSHDLLLHIQNSSCKFVFELGNTKTAQQRICRICNVTLKNFYTFIQHLYERHGIQGIYHLKENSQVKPCKICGQKFLSEAYLREHVQGKHSSVRRYACTCGKTFKWRSSFSGHRRNCSGTISCINKPYPTTMCRYTRKRQGLTPSSHFLTSPVVQNQEREERMQPNQMASDNQTGKIPGVHTILNNLKDKFPKQNTAGGFTGLKTKDSSPMPPRAHAEVTSQKPVTKSSTYSLKTDLNSPATQKIIESLKQRANVKWPTNKSCPKPDLKTAIPHPPHPVTTPSDPPCIVSSAPAANYQKGPHSITSSQTENSSFQPSTGTPYGMVFPVGDSMANLTQYLQYQNSFGINALNMQQLYHQMSASLSKMFSPENTKGNVNEKGLTRTEKSAHENLSRPYTSRPLGKSRDVTDQNNIGSSSQKKLSLPTELPYRTPLNCPTCKTSFTDKVSMEMHIQKCKNRPMSMYTCSICGMKLRGKASLREHTLGKHSATRYACSCGMKFKWRSSLGSHQKHCDDFMKKFY